MGPGVCGKLNPSLAEGETRCHKKIKPFVEVRPGVCGKLYLLLLRVSAGILGKLNLL